MKYLIKLFFLILFFFKLETIGFATTQNQQFISIDLQNVKIQDAIHVLAKFSQQNVVISPNINGNISLHLKHIINQDAFDLILNSQNLIRQSLGHTWYIMSRKEFLEREEEELKLKNILDETYPLTTRIFKIHYAKADEIAHFIQDNTNSLLSKRGHVRVDIRTNIICVQDIEKNLIAIQRVIQRLDIPVEQVLIEARLASVDNNCERELGINFDVKSPGDKPSPPDARTQSKHFSIAIAKLTDGSQLDIELAALEGEGHAELISSPSLFTASQQTASIESGEEIPYQEVNQQSGAVNITFKKAVLSLKVTPQIMPDNQVLLQLQVNQDRPSSRIVLGVPSISTRQISTNVLVHHGQTIVLGGIYESNHDKEEQRVPFFGRIPLVGWLFKQQNVAEARRELLIFVTPKIIPQCKGNE